MKHPNNSLKIKPKILAVLLFLSVVVQTMPGCGRPATESGASPGSTVDASGTTPTGTPPPATLDTTNPTVPGQPLAKTATSTSITLAWGASSDTGGSGLTGYKIFRAGALIGTSGTNSFIDTSRSPSTSYSYSVQAYDGAGNLSAMSISGNATTQSVPPPIPTVSLIGPNTIQANTSFGLTWTSTNTTSCQATGAWSGAKTLTGNQVISGITAQTTYQLTCTGAGGATTATKTVIVSSITDFGPNVYISADSLNGSTGISVRGASAGAGVVVHGGYAGAALTSLDFNGDGLSDLVIGEPDGEDFYASSANNADRGQVHVLFGTIKAAQLAGVSTGGFDLRTLNGVLDSNADGKSDGFSINGTRVTAATHTGRSLAAADLKCRGRKDLLIGQGNLNSTTAYTVFGGSLRANFELDNLTSGLGFSVLGGGVGGGMLVQAGHIFSGSCDQLLVAEPRWAAQGRTNAGLVTVILGNSIAGTSLNGKKIESDSSIFKFYGPANSRSGISMAVGDLDGDGLGEVAIGAQGANFLGSVYVVFGKALLAAANEKVNNAATPNSLPNVFTAGYDLATINPSSGFILQGFLDAYSLPANLGNAVTFLDLNKDGIQDLVVGARGDSSPGDVFVIFGRANGLHNIQMPAIPAGEGIRIFGEAMLDPTASDPGGGYLAATGSSISPAGDFNGDGTQDLLIGADGFDNGHGRAYVVFGSNRISDIHLEKLGSRGLILTGSAEFTSDAPGSFGAAVTGLGDFNGDGISDIAVGAPYLDAGPTRILSGKSYIFFGK